MDEDAVDFLWEHHLQALDPVAQLRGRQRHVGIPVKAHKHRTAAAMRIGGDAPQAGQRLELAFGREGNLLLDLSGRGPGIGDVAVEERYINTRQELDGRQIPDDTAQPEHGDHNHAHGHGTPKRETGQRQTVHPPSLKSAHARAPRLSGAPSSLARPKTIRVWVALSGRGIEQVLLLLNFSVHIRIRKRNSGDGDLRPLPRQPGIHLNVVSKVLGNFIFRVDGMHRARVNTGAAVDAIVRGNHKHIRAFVKTHYRTIAHALGIFTAYARFRYNIGHDTSFLGPIHSDILPCRTGRLRVCANLVNPLLYIPADSP